MDNLSTLVAQLWQVGITEIFVNGSFVEDKDHPNYIDGYFVCDRRFLASGELERQLNLLDPHKVWTWDPATRRPYRGYERLKRGEFDELRNLHGLGSLLISLRIACGLSQRQLAERLGVHESQVSRVERNEYHGITLERATRILDALGVEMRSIVEVPTEDRAVAV